MDIRVEQIMITVDEREFKVGDIVTIHFKNGGGAGGCKITKITNRGFHYSQGSGRDKSVSFGNLQSIE